jgi:hypothetical protein
MSQDDPREQALDELRECRDELVESARDLLSGRFGLSDSGVNFVVAKIKGAVADDELE